MKREYVIAVVCMLCCGVWCGCGRDTVRTQQDQVIQKAILEFDKHNGKGSHQEYQLSITENSEKWNVHFDRKGVRIPGHDHVVFVYKNGTRVKYMTGE